MKKPQYIFMAAAFILTAGFISHTGYAAGEPLPLAEVGSAEADQLNRAYESDLQGAVESPEEAARHQKALDRETGRQIRPAPAQQVPAVQPQSKSKHRPQAAKAIPMGGTESDLAPESEPAWLKQGGDPNNPPARRLRRASRAAAPQTQVSVRVDAANQKVNTPPFIFNPWSANLSDSDRVVLTQIAQLMKDRPADIPKLKVEAYSDNSGNPAINESLTVARAHVVKAYLILKGVNPSRLQAFGLGEKAPIASNNSKEGRAKNRRVEFKIAK